MPCCAHHSVYSNGRFSDVHVGGIQVEKGRVTLFFHLSLLREEIKTEIYDKVSNYCCFRVLKKKLKALKVQVTQNTQSTGNHLPQIQKHAAAKTVTTVSYC